MPTTEAYTSRSATGSQITRRYIASDYSTEALAIAAVHTAAPATISDMERFDGETRIDEIKEDTYSATVTWRLVEPSAGLNYSFTLGGNSFFRDYAISQTEYGANAIAMNDAIQWDGERVNGVTLPPRPGLEFTLERLKPIAEVDNAYIDDVSDLLLNTNSGTFEGFAAGEVLFLGLTGQRQGDGDWRLYYKFGRNPNETGLSVGSITTIAKEGWEYLWVYYDPKDDAANKGIGVEPRGVYVAQVFNDGNFAGLEL